jgi:C4-dicarboxylate transporter DctQ subunit
MGDKIGTLEKLLSVVTLGSICILVALQITSREVLSLSLGWTEELTRYAFIWLVFIGMSANVRNDEHIAMTYFANLFHGRLRKFLLCAKDISFLFFCGFVVFYGVRLCWKQYGWGRTIASLDVPIFVVTIAIPISFLLAAVHLVRRVTIDISELSKRERGLEND